MAPSVFKTIKGITSFFVVFFTFISPAVLPLYRDFLDMALSETPKIAADFIPATFEVPKNDVVSINYHHLILILLIKLAPGANISGRKSKFYIAAFACSTRFAKA